MRSGDAVVGTEDAAFVVTVVDSSFFASAVLSDAAVMTFTTTAFLGGVSRTDTFVWAFALEEAVGEVKEDRRAATDASLFAFMGSVGFVRVGVPLMTENLQYFASENEVGIE